MFCAFYFPPGERKKDTDTSVEWVSERLDKCGHRCLPLLCCDANARVGLSRVPSTSSVRTTPPAAGGHNARENYQEYAPSSCTTSSQETLALTTYQVHEPFCSTSRPARCGGEQVTLHKLFKPINDAITDCWYSQYQHDFYECALCTQRYLWDMKASAAFPTPHPSGRRCY